MKLNIMTHNIRALNDPTNILKYNRFLRSISPRVDVLLLQEHKLKGSRVEHLDKRLMPWSIGWILEVEPCYKSWLNPNGAGKGGVGIFLDTKYARLVTSSGAIMNNRVVWKKNRGTRRG